MSLEFALKKGGMPLLRNLMHQAEGVKFGLPLLVQNRTKINYQIRYYQNAKIVNRKLINSALTEAFPCKGDKK